MRSSGLSNLFLSLSDSRPILEYLMYLFMYYYVLLGFIYVLYVFILQYFYNIFMECCVYTNGRPVCALSVKMTVCETKSCWWSCQFFCSGTGVKNCSPVGRNVMPLGRRAGQLCPPSSASSRDRRGRKSPAIPRGGCGTCRVNMCGGFSILLRELFP